jgi:mannitol-1-phosphate 5-dehydrogenase
MKKMKGKVVIFGAGAIGRGLLADITFNSAYQVVFVEAVSELVDKLIKGKKYCVYLEGKSEAKHIISGYRALRTDNIDNISNEIAECAFATTSVGGANLDAVARLIAAGLAKRKSVLNILLCENWSKADHILTDTLLSRGCDKKSFACVPCSVERMAKSSEKGLDVIVESGQSLYADETRWKGTKPEIGELLFCRNIEAYYKRKLYTNNAGHVLLAYMGYLSGCKLLYKALEIPEIRQNLIDLLNVASLVLIKGYDFTKADMKRHIDELIRWRFSNRKLADTVKRVARDPLRKLGAEERLVGLIRLLEKHSLPTEPVSRVIAAAMHYFDRDDLGSVELSEIIAGRGPEAVLKQICGFRKNNRCYKECLHFFKK